MNTLNDKLSDSDLGLELSYFHTTEHGLDIGENTIQFLLFYEHSELFLANYKKEGNF